MLLIGISVVNAEVTVDFNVASMFTGASRLNNLARGLTFVFSIDGVGNVMLDASTGNTDQRIVDTVNTWDGNVGTVTESSLFNSSFTLVANASLANGISGEGNITMDGIDSGILAVQGQNASRIDGSTLTPPNIESLVWTLTSGNVILDIKSWVYGGSMADQGEARLVSGGTIKDYVNLAGTAGTLNVSNDELSIAGDRDLVFTVQEDASHGVGLGGFTFDVVFSLNMVIGSDLTDEVTVSMEGSSADFTFSGTSNGTLVVGSAATILTLPDAGGASPIDLGAAELSLELGSQWILDGSGYSGGYALGEQFVLAHFGSFSGKTWGVRFRNCALPPARDLQLFTTSTSLYYEVVEQTAATGPNIIIINVDDMVGGQHFSFEGRDCLTPTIDSFSANGIYCSQAFAASTVCGPSRYALMTGRWASRNSSENYLSKYPAGTLGRFGVSDTEMEDDGENLGAWLQRSGYRTGFVGKAHLIDDDLKSTVNWPSKGLITYSQTADPALDEDVNGAMRHNHRALVQHMRPYGFDYVASLYHANLLELRNDYLNVHNQEWITKGALEFIEENHTQRFFLYMAPTINHGPVRDDLSKSLLADRSYTSAGYLPGEDYSFMPSRQSIVDEVIAAGKQLISARETWLDYSLAAIANKLAEHGLENDTLVIFTADHGEKTLNKSPVIWGKSSLYDLGMRVPLVIYWPNGISSPGRVYDEMVGHIDFVPTLLELAGATHLPMRVLDGKSLVPVLNGSNASLRSDMYCEIGYARGVRTKEWKYVAVRYDPGVYAQIDNGYLWKNPRTGEFTEPRPYYLSNSSLGYFAQSTHPGYFDDDQLYSLASDPMEQTNLYGRLPAVTYDLKKRLANYMGGIIDRPFREFEDSSVEFSPAPSGSPAAPDNLQRQFRGVDTIQFDWSDTADNELGYILEQSTTGTLFEIIEELPVGSTSTTVSVSSGIEDIVFRVSSYNARGDTASAGEVDLLAPDNWHYRIFGSASGSNSQWTVDADGDGVPTIWEYAFATDPLNSNSSNRIKGEVFDADTNSWLQIIVPRDFRRAVSIQGCVSSNLVDWTVGAPGSAVVENTKTQLILRCSSPVESEKTQFLGAEITILD